jgi:putative membrane protein (TIGR04086 family)
MERKHSFSAASALKTYVLCGFIGALLTCALLAAGAAIIVMTGVYSSLKGPVLFVSSLIGGAMAGFLSARRSGKNGILSGGLAALMGALILSLPSVFSEYGGSVVPFLIFLIGGFAGGIAGVNLD